MVQFEIEVVVLVDMVQPGPAAVKKNSNIESLVAMEGFVEMQGKIVMCAWEAIVVLACVEVKIVARRRQPLLVQTRFVDFVIH